MLPKETTAWLRALGIAKILFEYEGYHCLYLEAIENFIWRKTMYSPRIREDLIPKLYHAAKAKRIPMTTLVNRILEKALNDGQEDTQNPYKEGDRDENPGFICGIGEAKTLEVGSKD